MKNCTWIGKSITKKSGESLKIACDPDCSLFGQDFDSVTLIPIEDISKVEHGKSIAFSCKPDCSWLNQEIDIQSGNQTTENFQYYCWEQDSYWGALTLSFTFLPGVALFIRLLQSKEVRKSFFKSIFAILASLIYPLTLFAVKTISLFQFGEEWKRVAALVTACESQVESFLQAGLQWYIMFSRPDRQASFTQLLAVFGSFAMIGFGQAKAAFANITPRATKFEDIKKMAYFTIGSFVMICNFINTAVAIAIFDKILFFVSYGIIVIIALTYLFLTSLKSSCLPKNDISKSKLKWIMLSATFLIGLIDCIIGLVMFNMDPDSYSYLKTQLYGDIAFGSFSAINFIFFLLCLIFGIFEKMEGINKMYYFLSFATILTAVIIGIIDKMLFFVSCGIILVMALTYLFLIGFKSSCLPQNGISKNKLKWIMLSATYLIGAIDFIIGFVMFNMDPDSYRSFRTQSIGNMAFGFFSAVYLYSFIFFLHKAIKSK